MSYPGHLVIHLPHPPDAIRPASCLHSTTTCLHCYRPSLTTRFHWMSPRSSDSRLLCAEAPWGRKRSRSPKRRAPTAKTPRSPRFLDKPGFAFRWPSPSFRTPAAAPGSPWPLSATSGCELSPYQFVMLARNAPGVPLAKVVFPGPAPKPCLLAMPSHRDLQRLFRREMRMWFLFESFVNSRSDFCQTLQDLQYV